LEIALNSRVSSGGGGDHFGQPSEEPITPEQLEFIFECLRHTPQTSKHYHLIHYEKRELNLRDFTPDARSLSSEPFRRLVIQWGEPREEPVNEFERNSRWLDKAMGLELAHLSGAVARVGICILGGESVELTPMIPYLSADIPVGFRLGNLPQPMRDSTRSALSCIENMRFSHSFSSIAPTIERISQILWAGYGCTPHTTHSGGTGDAFRRQGKTIPSGNAVYDLVLYTLMEDGIALYLNWDSGRNVPTHSLRYVRRSNTIPKLCKCLPRIPESPFCIIAASQGKLRQKSAVMEAGYAGLNISLQTEAIGLGYHLTALAPDETEAIQKYLLLEHSPMAVFSVGQPA